MSDDETDKMERAHHYLLLLTRDPELVDKATGWSSSPAFEFSVELLLATKGVDQHSRHHEPEYIEQVKNLWEELLKLDIEEINAGIELKKHQDWEKEQASKSYNRPDASKISLNFWARAATWDDCQAILLSLGREPNPKYLEDLNALSEYSVQDDPFAVEYFNRLSLLETAKEAGYVSDQGKSLEFVKWFHRMEYELPEALSERVLYFHASDNELAYNHGKSLTDVEKQTLLKLIAGMAVGGYGFDPTKKRSPQIAEIKSDLDILGLSLDEKTIRKWVRESCHLIDNQKE